MKKSEVRIGEEYAHPRGGYGSYSRVKVLKWVRGDHLHRTWAQQEEIERNKRATYREEAEAEKRAYELVKRWPGPGHATRSRRGVEILFSANEFEQLLERLGA